MYIEQIFVCRHIRELGRSLSIPKINLRVGNLSVNEFDLNWLLSILVLNHAVFVQAVTKVLDWSQTGYLTAAIDSSIHLWSGRTQSLQYTIDVLASIDEAADETAKIKVTSLKWDSWGEKLAYSYTIEQELNEDNTTRFGNVVAGEGHRSASVTDDSEDTLIGSGRLDDIRNHTDMSVQSIVLDTSSDTLSSQLGVTTKKICCIKVGAEQSARIRLRCLYRVGSRTLRLEWFESCPWTYLFLYSISNKNVLICIIWSGACR